MGKNKIKTRYDYVVTEKQLEEDAKRIAEYIAHIKYAISKGKAVSLTFKAVVDADNRSYWAWVFSLDKHRPLVCRIGRYKKGVSFYTYPLVTHFLDTFCKEYLKSDSDGNTEQSDIKDKGCLSVDDVLTLFEKYFGVKFKTFRYPPYCEEGYVRQFIYAPEGEQNLDLY